MGLFYLFENGVVAEIYCEPTAPKGIRRLAETLAEDLLMVTGVRPAIISHLEDCKSGRAIIVATAGFSPFLECLRLNEMTEAFLKKRECFFMKTLNLHKTESELVTLQPHTESSCLSILLIAGSDKRGTIYGMFHLSELCGVSPLVFWGDALPQKKETLVIDTGDAIISKEPKVKYRGFFINDEWPAFGLWCGERFGGVNAKAYEKVFELLLRLRGNYLWPAMWKTSFWEDDPKSASLADEYGIIMGTSHHEPLCRAGIEWQKNYKKYGSNNAWNFISNKDAITEFWKEGVERAKNFENVITIGMRGENDSNLMGSDFTLQDNINVLKDVITTQNHLLAKAGILKNTPRMLAIYKEVEDFYFGSCDCEGLINWGELDDVILLLSDDNFGNLRSIPQHTNHKGGYGIYYHFDYHGAPYSYEWLCRTNLAKVWEQLSAAYEYGIRDMWIVNVGDIKGNEYPLSFFMELAFDFDTWGSANYKSAAEFASVWIDRQFGSLLSQSQKERTASILQAYTQWSAARIPESLHSSVYKNSYNELENTKKIVSAIMEEAVCLHKEIPSECLPAFESMVYYPACASLNNLLISLEAGMNHLNAERGTLIANQYAESLQNRISLDRYYIDEFHSFSQGKWNHMMDSPHMGFRTWDDYNWTYPVIHKVFPLPCPKIALSFRGYNAYNLGAHWQDIIAGRNKMPVCNTEFTRPDRNTITIYIDSRGEVDFSYTVFCDKEWLSFSQICGESCLSRFPRIHLELYCDRSKLCGSDKAMVQIDFVFKNGEKTTAAVSVKACNPDLSLLEKRHSDYESDLSGVYLEAQDYLSMSAGGFAVKKDVESMGWRFIEGLGRMGGALKAFPVTKNWENEIERPFVRYHFVLWQKGEYMLLFYFSPRNPSVKGGTIKSCFCINGNEPRLFDVVTVDYHVGKEDNEWSIGVTDNIRVVKIAEPILLDEGLNCISVFAADPNAILENIVIHPKDKPPQPTHLVPPESYRIDTLKL